MLRDVVVVGAGPVGMTFALACAREGVPLELRAAPARAGATADRELRPIALSAASRRILDSLGVWPALVERCEPIRTVHVSERGRFGRVRIEAGEQGLDALGYVTDAQSIQRALDEALATAGTRCERTVLGRGGQKRLVEEDDLDADDSARAASPALEVIADGGGASAPTPYGRRRRDYGQDAVVCVVSPQRRHEGVAYERFLAGGPLALLPLRDDRCGLVWTLPAERAGAVAGLATAAFLASLQEAFGQRLGRFVDASPRQRFALSLDASTRLARARTVFIGNAANRLHPVAGQGLNLGLRDAVTLAELVSEAWGRGLDVGDERLLDRYAALRRADHRAVVAFTDFLARAFTWGPAPLGHLRSLLLLSLQLCPGARDLLARRAMGLAPPLPRAAREPWP